MRRHADAFYFMAGWWTPTMIATLNLLMALGRRFVVYSDIPVESGRTRISVKRLRAACLRLVSRRAPYVLPVSQMLRQARVALALLPFILQGLGERVSTCPPSRARLQVPEPREPPFQLTQKPTTIAMGGIST